MYANLNNVTPLPPTLQSRATQGLKRRNHVAGYALARDRVKAFNRLLTRLDPKREAIDSDQLCSAARDLYLEAGAHNAPASLRQRMRRAAAIERMTIDPDWEPANDAIGPAGLVVDYVRGGNDLIPDSLPKVGRLDDAIVIDTAWPLLSAEMLDYADYCRVRRIEAGLRSLRPRDFVFKRNDWLEAREAEVAWIAHCVKVGQSSYVSRPKASVFLIH